MRLLKISNIYLLLLITLFPLNASAQLIGVDDKKMNSIRRDLKKINTRLVDLKGEELKNLQNQLIDLLRQIEEIKLTIPQLQGTFDESFKEQTLSFDTIDTKLQDLDNTLKNEVNAVLENINKQNQTLSNFKSEQKISLENLKEQLTQNLNQLDSKSKNNFKEFERINKNALEQVVQRLEALEATTKESFDKTNSTLRSHVLTAIAKDIENNKTAVLQKISKLNQINETALEYSKQRDQQLVKVMKENRKKLNNASTKLDAIDKNLTARVVVLDKTLTAVKKNTNVNNKNQKISDEKMNKLAAAITDLQINNTASSQSLGVLKDNLVRVQEFEKLTDAKINKLIENSSQLYVQGNQLSESVTKVNQIASVNNKNLMIADEKISKLIENSSQLFVQGNQLSESVTKVNQIATVNNKNLMIADEKIIKLAEAIKILQVNSVTSGQALGVLKDNLVKVQEFEQLADTKINKLIENSSQLTVQANQLEESVIKELAESSRKEDSNQDKIDLANEKLSRLIEILKAIAAEQDKLGQVVKVQSELNKTQVGLVKNQESIKKQIAILRKQTTVSIQRGDDIKQILRNVKKK